MHTATEKEGVEEKNVRFCPNRTTGTMIQSTAQSWMLEYHTNHSAGKDAGDHYVTSSFINELKASNTPLLAHDHTTNQRQRPSLKPVLPKSSYIHLDSFHKCSLPVLYYFFIQFLLGNFSKIYIFFLL